MCGGVGSQNLGSCQLPPLAFRCSILQAWRSHSFTHSASHHAVPSGNLQKDPPLPLSSSISGQDFWLWGKVRGKVGLLFSQYELYKPVQPF